MKAHILYGAAAATALSFLSMPAMAQTQWIEDKLSDQCSAASKALVAENTRKSIEEQVRRAEASIQEPGSTADLSCMNDLLSANLDVFSSSWSSGLFDVEGMINDIAGGLKSGLSVSTLADGVERAICDFAEDQFGVLTEGVTSGLDDLLDPSTVLDQMHDYTDGFSSINLPISSSTGSSTIEIDLTEGTVDTASTGYSTTSTVSTASSNVVSSSSTQETGNTDNIQSIWNVLSGGN